MFSENSSQSPLFTSIDQVTTFFYKSQNLSEHGTLPAKNFIVESLKRKKNIQKIFFLMVSLRVNKKEPYSGFCAECVAQGSQPLQRMLLREENWKDVIFIRNCLRLLKITLDTKSGKFFEAGMVVIENVSSTLMSHITDKGTGLDSEIPLLLAKTTSLRTDSKINEKILMCLRQSNDPCFWSYFIDSRSSELADCALSLLKNYFHEKHQINSDQLMQLIHSWRRSDPEHFWHAYQINIQALEEIETTKKGTAVSLIEACNILCFAAFPKDLLIEQVNKLHSDMKQTEKTIVNYLVVIPYEDHSGKVYDSRERWKLIFDKMKALESEQSDVMCNLLATQFDNVIDMLHRIEKWSKKFGKFKVGVEMSHGSSRALGLRSILGSPLVNRSSVKRVLTGKDRQGSLAQRFMASFEDHPQFVLDSCLTGEGQDNIAQAISLLGAETIGSDGEVTSTYPNFNENGDMRLLPLFIGGDNIRFERGIAQTYDAPDTELMSSFD